MTDTTINSALINAQTTYNTANNLFEQKNYKDAAIKAKESLKIIQDHKVVDSEFMTKLISLTARSFLNSATTIAEKESNLKNLQQILPKDHIASNANFVSYLYHLSKSCLEEKNIEIHKGFHYLQQAIYLAKIHFPKEKTNSDLLEYAKNICLKLNKEYTVELLGKKDYENMELIAKHVYKIAKEFFKTDNNMITYATNLAVAYRKSGNNELALKHYEELLTMTKNNEQPNEKLVTFVNNEVDQIKQESAPTAAVSVVDLGTGTDSTSSPAENKVKLAQTYFDQQQYANSLSEAANAFKLLKDDNSLNTSLVDELLMITKNIYDVKTLSHTDKQALIKDILSLELQVFTAGNLKYAEDIHKLSEIIRSNYVSTLYGKNDYLSGLPLAEFVSEAMATAFPNGHKEMWKFNLLVGEGKISLFNCKEGLELIEIGSVAITSDESVNQTKVAPILDAIKDKCNPETLTSNAKTLFKGLVDNAQVLLQQKAVMDSLLNHTCESLNFNDIKACETHILGATADAVVEA